jgi:hypothetical protein
MFDQTGDSLGDIGIKSLAGRIWVQPCDVLAPEGRFSGAGENGFGVGIVRPVGESFACVGIVLCGGERSFVAQRVRPKVKSLALQEIGGARRVSFLSTHAFGESGPVVVKWVPA